MSHVEPTCPVSRPYGRSLRCFRGFAALICCMRITSEVFEHEGHIPGEFTADGHGELTPLQIHEVPTEAVSLVIISHDPDAPPQKWPGGNFDHWVVWGLPATTTELTGDADVVTLGGHVGANSLGANSYKCPAPPVGDGVHRYYFTLYALDTALDLAPGSDRQTVEDALDGHVLATATLLGRYERAS